MGCSDCENGPRMTIFSITGKVSQNYLLILHEVFAKDLFLGTSIDWVKLNSMAFFDMHKEN